MNIQPLHDLGAVRFDRLDADAKLLGDLFGRMTLGDQLQDFALARRCADYTWAGYASRPPS